LRPDYVTCQGGDVDFVFVGGNLALDLLGTLKWRRAEPEECLREPGDLARWAVAAGVLTAAPGAGDADLDAARALREAIYRLVRAAMTGDAPARADLDAVNEAAAGPPVTVTLTGRGARRTGPPAAVAAEVARAAITLLDGSYAGHGPRLRECERPACTRLFIDRSRGGTRAWCGMAECGNRIKAAGYRARRASAPREPLSTGSATPRSAADSPS
jgi:predicted RNA-binding Zn ribbon-like protein